MKYTCLVFGEGGRDRKFLIALIELDKFKFHAKNWEFDYDNASGSAPSVVLEQCGASVLGRAFDLVICFIDLDKLKQDYPNTWGEEKSKLESKYPSLSIIWFVDNAEEEFKKVLGTVNFGKHKLNKVAKEKIEEFINSNLWHRVLSVIKDKEEKLKELEEKK